MRLEGDRGDGAQIRKGQADAAVAGQVPRGIPFAPVLRQGDVRTGGGRGLHRGTSLAVWRNSAIEPAPMQNIAMRNSCNQPRMAAITASGLSRAGASSGLA